MKIIFKNHFGTMNLQDVESGNWAGSSIILLDAKKNICVVYENEKGYWTLPGGGKEIGENPEDCIRREVMEEAQCEIANLEYLMTAWGELTKDSKDEIIDEKYINGNRPQFRFIGTAKNPQDFVPRKNGFEIDERKFVTLEELPNYITWLNNSGNGQEFFSFLKDRIEKTGN